MLFKKKRNIDLYSKRLNVFSLVKDYGTMLAWYLNNEPHTLLNLGHAIKLFDEPNIGRNALSIGIDPVKEWALIEAGVFSKITTFDIDNKMVEIGNNFFLNKKINIQWVCKDILIKKI